MLGWQHRYVAQRKTSALSGRTDGISSHGRATACCSACPRSASGAGRRSGRACRAPFASEVCTAKVSAHQLRVARVRAEQTRAVELRLEQWGVDQQSVRGRRGTDRGRSDQRRTGRPVMRVLRRAQGPLRRVDGENKYGLRAVLPVAACGARVPADQRQRRKR